MIALNKNAKPRLPVQRKTIRAAVQEKIEFGYKRDEAIRVLASRWSCTPELIEAELITLARGPKPKGEPESRNIRETRELTRRIFEACESIMYLGGDARVEAMREIAERFGVTYQKVSGTMAKFKTLHADPTPEEIAAKCKAINANWSDRVRRTRAGIVTAEVETKAYTLTGGGDYLAYQEA